jgi:hypothetical protein
MLPALSHNHSLSHVSLQSGKISRVKFIDEEVVPLATGRIDGKGFRAV